MVLALKTSNAHQSILFTNALKESLSSPQTVQITVPEMVSALTTVNVKKLKVKNNPTEELIIVPHQTLPPI
jgi:hypothetical protein